MARSASQGRRAWRDSHRRCCASTREVREGKVSEPSIAYVAGLFDGEGHVAIQKATKSWYLRTGISMTHRPIIENLRERFGGCLSINTHPQRVYGRKLLYTWTATGHGAVSFLEAVRPHLIVKAEEVDLVLAYMADRPDGPGWRAWSLEDRDAESLRAVTYRDQLRALRAG